MSSPALRLRGVSKRFGTRPALDGVDLELGLGEFLVVLGPTGAGKTTLLRTVAGLEEPHGGSIEFDGRDGSGLDPAARDVALVFQNFSLYPTQTVRENLAFPLCAPGRGLDRAAITERVESVARTLHIERLLERPARALSGGEMQRVAIGRAIVRRPRLFLMDEPLSNLDLKLREELAFELRALVRRLGTATIWVTHDQTEALTMADRIAVLDQGRVLQTGTPEDLYERPASPAVARLLGAPRINLVRARRAGDWWTVNGERFAPAQRPVADSGPGDALLGIRPECIALDAGPCAGVVELTQDLGPVQLVRVRSAGVELGILCPRSRVVRRGDRVHPKVDPARIVVWSAETIDAERGGPASAPSP